MNYLTDEDYKVALSNGISQKLAYKRFYQKCWSKVDAITKSIDPFKDCRWRQYQKQCELNGITRYAFDKRIERGMSPEKAATKPMQKRTKKLGGA